MGFHVALVCSRRLKELQNCFPDPLFPSHHWRQADILHCRWGALGTEVGQAHAPLGSPVLLTLFLQAWT